MPSKLQTVQLSTSKCKLGPVNNTKANNRVEKWLHSALTLAINRGDLQGNNPRYPRVRRLGGPESKNGDKTLGFLGIEPFISRLSKAVVSHCTDCVISAPQRLLYTFLSRITEVTLPASFTVPVEM